MDFLNRAQSHLPDVIWREVEEAAVEAARERLTGRRYLDLQGPFGVGLTRATTAIAGNLLPMRPVP
jgi:uncharacterized linocin/CFP29 family protein